MASRGNFEKADPQSQMVAVETGNYHALGALTDSVLSRSMHNRKVLEVPVRG